MDHEKLGLKLQSVLDSISVCLDQLREEFTLDIILNALGKLSDEKITPIVPRALMRTCLSIKYDNVKRIVLVDIIPKLIAREVWKQSVQIWDGVVLFIKKFSVHKDADVALKSVLTLPLYQLKGLIDSCSSEAPGKKTVDADIKKLLKKALVTCTKEQKDKIAEVKEGDDVRIPVEQTNAADVTLDRMKIIEKYIV